MIAQQAARSCRLKDEARLRAEPDAAYGHLYGLTQKEMKYVLETSPVVRGKDEQRYGEYRTKRLVLEAFERIVLQEK